MIKLLQLAWAFMQVGITAFGGGISTLSLIEYQLVEKYGWFTREGFNRMVSVSQITPGPIAVNAATFAGYEQAGVAGSIVATVALVAAPVMLLCVVLLVLRRVSPEKSKKFKTMLRPIVAGLLSLSLISPLTATVKNGVIAVILFALGLFCLNFVPFFKKYPAAMLILFGAAGSVLFSQML